MLECAACWVSARLDKSSRIRISRADSVHCDVMNNILCEAEVDLLKGLRKDSGIASLLSKD